MTHRIGITMRLSVSGSPAEERDAISHDWCRALERIGVTYVLLPNGLLDPVGYFQSTGCQALLLSNGDDLGETGRDTTENALLAFAVRQRLPTLGVCRGFQHIARFFDASICPDVAGSPGAWPHVAVRHEVQLEGALRTLFGTESRSVNSFHRHGLLVRDVPAVLAITARASGDVVEGFAHRELPIWGVQWHPERASPDAEGEARLLRHFAAGYPELR